MMLTASRSNFGRGYSRSNIFSYTGMTFSMVVSANCACGIQSAVTECAVSRQGRKCVACPVHTIEPKRSYFAAERTGIRALHKLKWAIRVCDEVCRHLGSKVVGVIRQVCELVWSTHRRSGLKACDLPLRGIRKRCDLLFYPRTLFKSIGVARHLRVDGHIV